MFEAEAQVAVDCSVTFDVAETVVGDCAVLVSCLSAAHSTILLHQQQQQLTGCHGDLCNLKTNDNVEC